jgi:8-oxo-dGTP diphosphatase
MNYNSPKLTVDGVVIKDKKILLIKRKKQPFKGKWALPGGFVEYGEKIEDAAVREVLEETGLKTKISHLVGVYSDPDRDPRGHTITVVYLLEICNGNLKSGDDVSDVKFFDLNHLPELSFDHKDIIKDILRGVR